ncbi:uncharacterized protein SEPMUDRAFT_149204 [Sphaerulina musiva SO2202]|uniref:Uncharacterized protein n=1 Tax=Sphaerulina musiva (strain SO2202) TaxID=692275 RepID=M3AYG7_SPHMS|nr:uncharacterized protein SEPMUDRAFT_149204 [Sphaerulina musiva SO2202]EMF12572.1 hypothetical protein SEPMUDRAFT_149204 [Sphaerulina musiva SO2202]
MHSFSLLITASTAFAVAIPLPGSTYPSPPCPSTTVTENLSSAFGWQLAGTVSSASSLSQTCTDLQDKQLLKWLNIGLDLTQVEKSACGTRMTSASDVLPKVVVANTETTAATLTRAFAADDYDTFGYLCDNLSYKRVAGFLLDENTIINATCQLAAPGGRIPNPAAFSVPESEQKNSSAIAAYADAQSQLYAYLYAAQASSTSDLDTLCQSASGEKEVASYDALQMNAERVRETICALQEPISVEQGKDQMKQWVSASFATVLVNASGVEGFASMLCEKLSVEGLESVGLDGELVKSFACNA